MSDSHPDWAALDAVRTGEVNPEETAHVASCGDCRRAMEELHSLASRLRPVHHFMVVEVPSELRAVVRMRAAKTINRPRRRRWIPAAVAALLLAALSLWRFGPAPRIPGDIDGSGRVNIVDAYCLAVSLQTGEGIDLSFDQTGDGRVDAEDVDEIARVSVALGDRGGR